MALPAVSDIATTTVAGVFLASTNLEDVGRYATKKFIRWALYCPYRVRSPHQRRSGVRTTVARFLKKRLRSTFRFILDENKVKAIANIVKFVKNPYSELIIDEEEQEALNKVLNCCDYYRPVPFWIAVPFWKQVHMKKITAGAYGEIYSTINTAKEDRIFKFVPIHGEHPDPLLSNVTFKQIAPDIVCSRHLPKLNEGSQFQAPNFPRCYKLHLVRGKFPYLLIKAWYDYETQYNTHSREDTLIYPRPDTYSSSQFFAVLELQHCGNPLAKSPALDIMCYLSCICQATSALAVAEQVYQFEHRDLHHDNILLRKTSESTIKYAINGKLFEVDSYGIQISIIDFTMSRITVNNHTYSMDLTHASCPVTETTEPDWTDHNLLYDIEARACDNNWSTFTPVTNVYWLRHLVENLLQRMFDLRGNQEVTPVECDALISLRKWGYEMMRCNSATEFLQEILFTECRLIREL